MGVEIFKFIIYTILIVVISKYVLSPTIRRIGKLFKLDSKFIGNISGFSTSAPEFLTIIFASFNGLIETSIFNVLSSNVINMILYLFSIIKNKNIKKLKNKGILLILMMVVVTIAIPIVMSFYQKEMNIMISIIFILLFFVFLKISDKIDKKIFSLTKNYKEKNILKDDKVRKLQMRKIINYIIILIFVAISLYFIGKKLGDLLELLAEQYNISQIVLGLLLGFITSIPELMTFMTSQKHHNKRSNSMKGVVETTHNLLTSNISNLFIIQSLANIIYLYLAR